MRILYAYVKDLGIVFVQILGMDDAGGAVFDGLSDILMPVIDQSFQAEKDPVLWRESLKMPPTALSSAFSNNSFSFQDFSI